VPLLRPDPEHVPAIDLACARPELHAGDLDVFQPYRTAWVEGQHGDFGLSQVVDPDGVVVCGDGGGP